MSATTFRRVRSLWVPADAGAKVELDTTLPGGFVLGTAPGIGTIRDWSGNGAHATQGTAAQQGTFSTSGPGSAFSATTVNVNQGWIIPISALAPAKDHTLVIGFNAAAVPNVTHAAIGLATLRNNAYSIYCVLGTASALLSINTNVEGNQAIDLSLTTGVHSYILTLDNAGALGKIYLDGVKGSTDKIYSVGDHMPAAAGDIYLELLSQVVAFSPAGAFWRFAYWNRVINSAELASAHAWAVRTP